MPLEALALMLDAAGLGAPLWANRLGDRGDPRPGTSRRIGGWRGRHAAVHAAVGLCADGHRRTVALPVDRQDRSLGLALRFGATGATVTGPDLLVTGDGQHLALVRGDGVPVLLRSRSGDFVRDLMSEASAYDGDPANLEEQRFARCSRDACIADIVEGDRAWRLLAIRSRNRIDWSELTKAAPTPISSSPIAGCRAAVRRAG